MRELLEQAGCEESCPSYPCSSVMFYVFIKKAVIAMKAEAHQWN
jgi:hypothetical protein